MTTNKNVGACPECDADITFKKTPTLGQKAVCPECRDELIVVGLNPIELDWDYDDEDYDDYDDDDDDY